jgi:MoxR-like ATPase
VEAVVEGGVERVPELKLKEYQKTPTNLRRMQEMLKDYLLGHPLLIEGEQGTGKDFTIAVLANALSKGLVEEPTDSATEADDMTGRPAMKRSVHAEDKGSLEVAVDIEGIWYGNELNRGRPGALAILHNMLQDRYVTKRDGTLIDARGKPKVWLIASINPYREPFNTYQLDIALKSRFKKLRFEYLPEGEEVAVLSGNNPEVPAAVIERLVKGANLIRAKHREDSSSVPYTVSMRVLEKVVEDLSIDAGLMYKGGSLIRAFLAGYGVSGLDVELGKET